jgi:hypothetical protein
LRRKWNSLLHTVPLVLAHGDWAELAEEFTRRIFSTRPAYLLRRDTTTPLNPPRADIPIVVRSLRREDIPAIVKERPMRLPALRAGLSTCCLAATAKAQICYVQWLIDPSQNGLIAREFTGLCPPLSHDEMLLKWAYTFRRFRGMGIMGDAMAQICEKALAAGAHWLYIFVAVDDVATLKTCSLLGFRPHQMCTESWRFFHLTQSFEQFPKGARYAFEHNAAG